MGMLSVLLLATLALAEGFFVEGPEVDTRAEAVAMAQAAQARGITCRVVRRYRHGAGWVFVVVTETYEDRIQASAAATTLAGSTGRGMTLYSTSDDQAVVVPGPEVAAEEGVDSPPAEADQDAILVFRPEDAPPLDGTDDVERILRRIQRAHGGVDGGTNVLARADSVVFRFTRETPAGQVIEHVYARAGESRYLAVKVVEGEGTSTIAAVTPQAAWSAQPDGAPLPVDRERTLETIERFSPERVLGLALSVAADVESRPELQQLRRDGETSVEGDACAVLRHDGDRVVPPLVVAVSTTSWLIRQLGFDNGVLKQMSDYARTESGLVYPRELRVWQRRAIADTIHVTSIELGSQIPAEWLRNPFAVTPPSATEAP